MMETSNENQKNGQQDDDKKHSKYLM